ncbi:hypothetical protein KKA93_00515 [Patescibacteria group bacterium]|nr:hypothetical protein [Patescibacteria group bacterium]MBU1663278.1 hypothetical protein [Patescibacteria group bacterium]MBU1933872.1 hypothetical protein [Patescibacteria group bacterium]MBU2007957.1 hypothetical protein [Patescibacteria group bacterium]MBU2233571.1 hypothetical protein [Patescibacteria group bacterium]
MANLDSTLLRNQNEENNAAGALRQDKRKNNNKEEGDDEEGGAVDGHKNSRGGSGNMANDSQWRNRLDQAKQRSKNNANLEKNFIGKQIAKSAANKVAEGSTKIFIVLLFIALMVDLLEYLDFGIFSALVNVGIYAIVVTAGFFTWFLKNNNNKYNIFNLLKGQMWKYLIMPLFEMFPLINVLPFWTGTVVMMWVKVSYERKKLGIVNKKDFNTKD